MARKSTKTTDANMSAIDEAINTPVNFQFGEVAEALGIGEVQLRERLEDKTGNAEVHQMDTIPCDWEPAIKAIKIDLEAEASVRRLNVAPEPSIPQPQAQEEPPLAEEEPQSKKRSKAKSGTLTNTRKSSLEKASKSSKKSTDLEQIATATLAAQKGTRKGANLAAIELTAQEGAYQHVKKEGLKRQIAKLASELEAEKNFDPQEMLAALGIPGLEETETELNDLIEGTLGKLGNVTEEILSNSWMNGFDADVELENLQALLNLND
jgi:hypothetical protein